MRTTNTMAISVAILLGAACGHEEPAKTAYEAPAVSAPAEPIHAQISEAPMPASTGGLPTSADVPREGPKAGNAEAQAAPMLTDGQILQVTHTANLGEIDQARLALTRTKDARVRSLAQMMVRDHSQADKKGMILAKKENVEREPSSTSEALESDVQSTTATLKAEPGADFDKDYVSTQIREHQGVLDTLDQKLIVSATNPDLRMYLVEVRAAVASHLQHAQELQNELQK